MRAFGPAIAFGLLLALMPAAKAGSQAGAKDPAEAHALLKEAIGHAGRADWKDAFAELDHAHRLARTDPAILYALGAVHAKAGDDIAAMYWLEAYLLAVPEAANRAQVTRQIAASEAAARAKEQLIYRAAERLAGSGDRRVYVAKDEAEVGHVRSALKLTGNADADEIEMEEAWFAAGALDADLAKDALSRVRGLSVEVASFCDTAHQVPHTNDHRWDGLARSTLTGRFFVCIAGDPPGLGWSLRNGAAQAAIAAVSDPSIKAEAQAAYAEWRRSQRPSVYPTPLDAWLHRAELAEKSFNEMSFAAAFRPSSLAADDEASALALSGSYIGEGIAEFYAYRALIVP